MVKGISRQVIVVHSPDPKLFDQAIFILKDGQQGVSDEALLREAKQLITGAAPEKKPKASARGLVWSMVGALLMGLVWLVVTLL